MDNTNTYCVYIHRNKKNGKVYIGQTKYGNSPNKRWAKGKGYQENVYFYNAIQKYGWDKFEHFVLMQDLTLEQANYYEHQFIALYNSCNPEFGYNVTTGGGNYIIPPETLKIKRKKEKFEDKIAQFDINGNLIAIWDTPTDAEISTQVSGARICNCCHSQNYDMLGGECVWRRCAEIIEVNNYINIGKIPCRFWQVLRIDKNNNIRVWDSIKEASCDTGDSVRNIQAICGREMRTLKNPNGERYFWSYFISPIVVKFIHKYSIESLKGMKLQDIRESIKMGRFNY
jgi:hypothetical protein